MGVTKRLLEQAELDHAAAMVCQYALSEGLVDESKAEGGIAKLLASGDKGLSELSQSQQDVYHNYIEPHGDVQCSACGEQIQPDELMFFSDNGGLCSHCQYRLDQMMKE
jgi:hypothetical protein|nr:MAG TPA: Transcription initiation factor IIE, alpha FINGER, Transcription [Caudoviricetes sp.]